MTWDETMELLHGSDWKSEKLGLTRMLDFLDRLGNPQEKLRFVHVAGTNGKGSASAMLAAILRAAGLKTGLYISPHLYRMNERMSINGIDISDAKLTELAARLRPLVTEMSHPTDPTREALHPTAFELITALAFLYFAEEHCDIVVLEVGMGGRLDATNVISVPECAVIMNIGLEHTEVLGDTLEKIAREKAGIVKPGGDVVLYHQTTSVEAVVRSCCETRDASLTITDPTALTSSPVTRETLTKGQTFSYRNHRDLTLRLLGNYQLKNAMVVLDVIDTLRRKGWEIPEDAVRLGLKCVVWPGRFELLSKDPLVIIDGAHNPNGVEALVDSIRTYLAGRRITFLIGVMADKNYHEMLRLTAPFASRFITEMPGNDRALSQSALNAEIRRYFQGPVETAPSVLEGLKHAMELLSSENNPDNVILCFGSLYQVGEIRAFFGL